MKKISCLNLLIVVIFTLGCKNRTVTIDEMSSFVERDISIIDTMKWNDLINYNFNYDSLKIDKLGKVIEIKSNSKIFEFYIDDLYYAQNDSNLLMLLFSFFPNELVGEFCLLEYDKVNERAVFMLLQGLPKNVLIREYDYFRIYNVLTKIITEHDVQIISSSIMLTGDLSYIQSIFSSFNEDL